MEYLKNSSFFGNSLYDWSIAAAVTFTTLFVLWFIRILIVKRLSKLAKKTETDIDDAVVKFVQDAKLIVLFVISAYVGLQFVSLPESKQAITRTILILACLYQLIVWSNDVLEIFIEKFVRRGRKDLRSLVRLFVFVPYTIELVWFDCKMASICTT